MAHLPFNDDAIPTAHVRLSLVLLRKTINMCVEVFRTNVSTAWAAMQLLYIVHDICPGAIISLDLADCDRVLRVEGQNLSVRKMLACLHDAGIDVSGMPD